MHTLSIVCQKGGVSKTTTAINLAVAAHLAGKAVLVIDLDMQASAFGWHQTREDKSLPVLATHPAALKGVLDVARAQGVDLVIIDTAAKTESDALVAIEVADTVLIPCRPSAMDLRSIMNTVRLCKTRDIAPHVLLTQVEPQGKAADESREALKQLGIDVLDCVVGRRNAFIHSINDGRAAC